MMDKVVHFEITADSPERAKKFYEQVFGWKIASAPGMDYHMVMTGEVDENRMHKEKGVINGGMMKRMPEIRNPVITIAVASIDESLKKLSTMGGKVVKGKSKVGDMGHSAYFRDTEGNILGLWENAKPA
jgi:uncharacterized protein